MAVTMEFKFLTVDDAEYISDYLHEMWVGTYANLLKGGRPTAESIYDKWAGPHTIREDFSKGFIFVHPMVDGKPVGLISGGKEGDQLWVSKVYIEPEYKKKGYGGEGLEFLLDYGRRLGCSTAGLQANPQNSTAISFYEHHGFEVTGRIQYPDKYTLVMTKQLRS